MSRYFVQATIMLWLSCVYFTKLSLMAYAPFLALCALLSPTHTALWWAAIAGSFVDIFSATPPGWHALNYVLISFCLTYFRSYFFFEKAIHICLYTAIFSAASTLLDACGRFFFDKAIVFSKKELIVDLVISPCLDAGYAFLWFLAPLFAIKAGKQFWMEWNRGRSHWFRKRRKLA